MNGDVVPVLEEMVPKTNHNSHEIILIRKVTSMIAYRNRMIATYLNQFEQGSDWLHQERKDRGVKKRSEYLIGITDQIHELVQDNAYDIRNLMIYLERKREQGITAGGTTGHDGQVSYIQ